MYNYRKGGRPLRLTLKESVRLQVSTGLITCRIRDEREEQRAESDDMLMENQRFGHGEVGREKKICPVDNVS